MTYSALDNIVNATGNVLAAWGLFSLVCYLLIVSRIACDRVQTTIHANDSADTNNTPFPSRPEKLIKRYLKVSLERASLNFSAVFNRPSQDTLIIQLWRARLLHRIHTSVEVAVHSGGVVMLSYAIFMLVGKASWFRFLFFAVGVGAHHQLEVVCLAFSLCLIFLVCPQSMTLLRANAMHAVLLAALFVVIESEARGGIRTFTLVCIFRIALGFIFCNLPWTIFLNVSFAVVRAVYIVWFADYQSKLPGFYLELFKIEIMSEVLIYSATVIAESQLHDAVRTLADSHMARRSESAMKHLLGLLCDAAFYLGPELRFYSHSPELAALLLRQGGRSLEGCDFEELIQPADRDRFNSHIEEAVRSCHQRESGGDFGSICRSLDSGSICRSWELESMSGSSHDKKLRFQDPLVVHLKAASSTSVCVEIFHIVNRDINERVIHLIGLREVQQTINRNESVIQELPPPEHLMLSLSGSSSQRRKARDRLASPQRGTKPTTAIQDLASLRGVTLQGGGSENIGNRRSTRSSTSSADSGSSDSSCDDTDITNLIQVVDLNAEDGKELVAVWVDVSSPALFLLRTTRGFAKLGRPCRQGDTLFGLLVSDSRKVMATIKSHINHTKEDCSLYTEDGPVPCALGRLRFRLRYTLAEVSADCELQLQPSSVSSDSDSDRRQENTEATRKHTGMEARIVLSDLKHREARRNIRPRTKTKDKTLVPTN